MTNQVNIEINFGDIAVLNLWVNFSSKINWAAIIVIGLIGVDFMLQARPGAQANYATLYAAFAYFCFLCFAMVMAAIPLIAAVTVANLFIKGSRGKMSFAADGRGIKETNIYKETFVEWPKIRRIGLTNNHIFIKFTHFKYFILPKRCFEDEADFAMYYASLVKFKSDSTSKSMHVAKQDKGAD